MTMKQFLFSLGIATVLLGCSVSPDTPPAVPIEDEKTFIQVLIPAPNQKITSPLQVSGQARGNWFFEATAPLILVDWDGRIIAQSYIQATDDWMTEDFVPFEGTLNFELPETTPYKRGAIIFQKSNPSDLPENDDAIEIPIEFE